jgi:predicted metal-dependent enzyme (double-stranded beta helix superfamily)
MSVAVVESIQLPIHGQGVFVFKTNFSDPCSFTLYDTEKVNGLCVEFTEKSVNVRNVSNGIAYEDSKCRKGLDSCKDAYYWFSLDSQNQRLCAGIGETRLETVTYGYVFSNENEEERKVKKQLLESLTTIWISEESVSLSMLRLLKDPVTTGLPLHVKHTNQLTMHDLAKWSSLPHSSLTMANQMLYSCIAGSKFVLNDPSFPDFSKAIEYSIATPGLWCHERLKQKENEFSKTDPQPLETYLRITLGQNSGESPGIPYVMEIWPVGHYSPIHNHGGANAVIRVLHGSIHVELFPYLCTSKDGVIPFVEEDFKKDDITWISPNLNQTHRLTNLPTNKDTCITIQCYMYGANNTVHYDYFDYIDTDGNKQQYEPDSDMEFLQFKELIHLEWLQRHRKSWLTYAKTLLHCTK